MEATAVLRQEEDKVSSLALTSCLFFIMTEKYVMPGMFRSSLRIENLPDNLISKVSCTQETIRFGLDKTG